MVNAKIKERAEEADRLICLWRNGDQEALNPLTTLLHNDLREIAHRLFARERIEHTLQTDDLISQLYLKMLGSKSIPWENHTHFLHGAARAMRQILVDHSRTWERRVIGKKAVPLADGDEASAAMAGKFSDESLFHIVALSNAIEHLSKLDKQMGKIADLRLIVGLTLQEIAECLALEIMKVKRDWLLIKSYLQEKL